MRRTVTLHLRALGDDWFFFSRSKQRTDLFLTFFRESVVVVERRGESDQRCNSPLFPFFFATVVSARSESFP